MKVCNSQAQLTQDYKCNDAEARALVNRIDWTQWSERHERCRILSKDKTRNTLPPASKTIPKTEVTGSCGAAKQTNKTNHQANRIGLGGSTMMMTMRMEHG
jgi:hypothetical protein